MFAIAGGKGGCGKTTTAVGLARALARRDAEVLVVDADRDMPNLHRTAAIADRPPTGEEASTDRDTDHARDVRGSREGPLARARPSRLVPGLSVLPARAYERLEGVLQRVERWPGPVLVDCPAGASPDATMPLRYADETLLVTTTDPPGVRDAIKTAVMADALDAPASVAVIRDTGGVPVGRVARALDCHQDCPVPDVAGAPLADAGVRRSYDALACLVSPSAASPAVPGRRWSDAAREPRP